MLVFFCPGLIEIHTADMLIISSDYDTNVCILLLLFPPRLFGVDAFFLTGLVEYGRHCLFPQNHKVSYW